MKKRRQTVTGILLLLMVSLLLSSCQAQERQRRNEQQLVAMEGTGSVPVSIVGYLIGSPPPGLQDVMAELNARLIKDVGVHVEIKYIPWGDLAARYPFVLSSGEQVDFIFAANWAYYTQEAAKGVFMEITEEMIKEHMPLHYQATSPRAWQEAIVGGSVYMIPGSTLDMKVPVTLIRGDLRKKYGLPEIRRFSDLEPYLAAVQANEPDMVPIRVDKQYDFSQAHYNLLWENGPAIVDLIITTNGFSGVFTDWDDPEGKLFTLFDEPVRTSFLQAANTVKRWYDSGYISRDAFANKVRSKDAFEQGISAVAYGNSNDIHSTILKAESKGWEVEIIPNLSMNRTYSMDPYINNGVAIAKDCQHPELVMRALDLIMEDPEYIRLVYYGVEGKNYIIKDGQIALPEGVTPDSNDYPPDAAGFWFTNRSYHLTMESWNEDYRHHKEQIGSMLVPYVYSSFNFNAVPVRRELEKINQAGIQYLNPIISGMVVDVEKAFNQLEAEVMVSGYDRVLAEAKKQTAAYLQMSSARRE